MTTIEGSFRTGQSELKRQCLDRDGGRCVLSGAIDTDRYGKMPPGKRKGAKHSRTECAHILPFALSKLKEKAAVQVQNKATTWWALYEYFPALQDYVDILCQEKSAVFTVVDNGPDAEVYLPHLETRIGWTVDATETLQRPFA